MERLSALREKFGHFLSLLDDNNRVLKLMSELTELLRVEHFDLTRVHPAISELRAGAGRIVESMIALGGGRYETLRDRRAEIDAEIEELSSGHHQIREDALVIRFEELDQERSWSVGSKCAQLGEMMRRGFPVPPGFAISAWAYSKFLEANDLQSRISKTLSSLDVKDAEALNRASQELRELISESRLPAELASVIAENAAELCRRFPNCRLALRSSAIGEDTQYSFAGRYESFLNVRPDEVLASYREIISSKFSPKSIYYFVSHGLEESELAMGVGVMAMVDAASSGVIYTRDPTRPEDGSLLIHSIFGLGKHLVEGVVNADEFRVSRADGALWEEKLSRKPVKLGLAPDRGTVEKGLAEERQLSASLTPAEIRELHGLAMKIESHYRGPRDIEWAIDREGRAFILQSRPLRVMSAGHSDREAFKADREPLIAGGNTVCHGAGGGPVHIARNVRELSRAPAGAVLVAPHPFPGMITALSRISALVTVVSGVASHAATIAREYRVPSLAGVERALELEPGREVTVDATGRAIYPGLIPELIRAREPDETLSLDLAAHEMLRRALGKISKLGLVDAASPMFCSENCMTLHDLSRFCHQKAMDEMFAAAVNFQESGPDQGLRLKSEIPLEVKVIYIDQEPSRFSGQTWIQESELNSTPMQAFWDGVKLEGWPGRSGSATDKKASPRLAQKTLGEYSEKSFAILGKEYMILSLRMGYHFTTFESVAADEPSKNYIRMQYKSGGATLERRTRRVRLLIEILESMGFENFSKGDFLDTMITYLSPAQAKEKLQLLGRLTIMTKQLDMVLSNDAIAKWYAEDFIKKLGLSGE